MLLRKITVSFALFLVILATSGYWNHKLNRLRESDAYVQPSSYSFNIYSARHLVSSPIRSYPFSPREYVRIIHRLNAEQAP